MTTLSYMICWVIRRNMMHRFRVQALQDPPFCSSTQKCCPNFLLCQYLYTMITLSFNFCNLFSSVKTFSQASLYHRITFFSIFLDTWAHGLSPFSQETTLGRDRTKLTILYMYSIYTVIMYFWFRKCGIFLFCGKLHMWHFEEYFKGVIKVKTPTFRNIMYHILLFRNKCNANFYTASNIIH